jgi:hypothetical protein
MVALIEYALLLQYLSPIYSTGFTYSLLYGPSGRSLHRLVLSPPSQRSTALAGASQTAWLRSLVIQHSVRAATAAGPGPALADRDHDCTSGKQPLSAQVRPQAAGVLGVAARRFRAEEDGEDSAGGPVAESQTLRSKSRGSKVSLERATKFLELM